MVYKIQQYNIIMSFDVEENIKDQCIYLKFNKSKFIILVLFLNDILVNSDLGLLH